MKASGLNGQSWPGIREDEDGNFVLGENKDVPNSGVRIPKEMLDLEMPKPNIPEEFNKKVFALIEMSQDDKRRSQKQLDWCSWF